MTTHTDYRAALAEIADLLDQATDPDDLGIRAEQAIARARDLLAAPEAVGVADEEITEIAREEGLDCQIELDDSGCDFEYWWASRHALISFARELLARYGTAHPAPVPVGDAVAAERERWLKAVEWALGTSSDGFEPPESGHGRYWWRKELAERCGITWDGERWVEALPGDP